MQPQLYEKGKKYIHSLPRVDANYYFYVVECLGHHFNEPLFQKSLKGSPLSGWSYSPLSNVSNIIPIMEWDGSMSPRKIVDEFPEYFI